MQPNKERRFKHDHQNEMNATARRKAKKASTLKLVKLQ